MRIVADHLAGIASGSGNTVEFDLFGRSAFNRYYYAAFLSVRSVLKSLDSAWARPSHQSLPDLLKGEVLKRAKRQIGNATKSGQMTHTVGSHLYNAIATAASDLSNLLTLARETRRLADYEPETLVEKKGSVVILGASTLETARKWESRIDAQAKTIRKIYAHLGLI